MTVEPIKEAAFPGDGPIRTAALAKRLGVRHRPSEQCVVGLPGAHGEFYDWTEMCHAFMDRMTANEMP